MTVVGTRVLQGVRARDKDQQGPFSTVQYTVQPGPNSVSSILSVDILFSYTSSNMTKITIKNITLPFNEDLCLLNKLVVSEL